MSSKPYILNQLQAHTQNPIPLEELTWKKNPVSIEALWKQFEEEATLLSASFITLDTLDNVNDYCQQHFANHRHVVTTIANCTAGKYVSLSMTKDVKAYLNVDLAIIQAHFAVAENGALWIDNQMNFFNALPFITQDLMIIIEQKNIVDNMHTAYEQLDKKAYDYGVFISGPSKTADIAQSLVIGAHGAMSLHIIVLKNTF